MQSMMANGLASLIGLESPQKHTSMCVHEGVSEKVYMRREDPECGWYPSMGWGPRLNKEEKLRAVDVAQRVLDALPKDLGSILSSHTEAYNCL